jgi:transposase InsO family protein
LQDLLGRENESFTVPTQIVQNGYSIPIHALGDTGANGFLFIDTAFAVKLAKFFKIRTIPIGTQCAVNGYDGKQATPITHALVLTLNIDGRRQASLPALIVNLGRHNMILGRMWFAKYGVLPDCRQQRLIWPEERSVKDQAHDGTTKTIPKSILRREEKVNHEHQSDADHRDKRMEKEIQQERRKQLYQPSRTFYQDQRDALSKMKRAMQDMPPIEKKPPRKKPSSSRNLVEIDIAAIGGAAFDRHMKDKKSEVFIVSLYEIDQLIDHKRAARLAKEGEKIRDILPGHCQEHLDVFSKELSDEYPPSRSCDFKIELESEPALGYCPLYKMSMEELEAAKQYIVENLNKGFIEASKAPYASPILMAKKPGGGLRFCVDYRKLNAVTKKNRYPLPLIDEVLERLSRAKIFTKLDIRQGFHRIRIHPDSQDLTTFRTRYGSYKYKVVPFGLTNGPSTFQQFINDTFIDYLDDFMTAYVDDLLIYSQNELEHQVHVKLVLDRLRAAGLQVAIHKCEFSVTRTKYLGFIISTEGIEVDPSKIGVIKDWQVPTTVRGVQSFLGFCNFYRRFIKDYSRIAKPLTTLTKSNTPFIWDQACRQAFENLKDYLSTSPVLRYYDYSLPTKLETDASDGVVAGVLSQQHGREWHPVAYFSKSMAPPEQNYEIHDKEMLAIVRALEQWRAELEGLQRDDRFDIFTDHRALEYFMTKKVLNARQARWLEFISRFHFLIRYRPGKSNTLADALSRQPGQIALQKEQAKEYRYQQFIKDDCIDDEIKSERGQEVASLNKVEVDPIVVPIETLHIIDRVLQQNRASPLLENDRHKAQEGNASPWSLKNGLLFHNERLVVPDDGDLRARLLDDVHRQVSTAHPGRHKTRELVRARYWWPTWRHDTLRYVDNCLVCKRTKIWRDKTPGLLQPLPIPDRPWQHLSMDFRSFPKDRHGFDSVFVIVDRLSKRPISIPCYKTTSAKDMARIFVETIYRWKGPPDSITSDRGGQFVSEFWDEVCKTLGIKIKLSTSHHPQTDGQTEIANQYMAIKLRPFVNFYQDNWSELLPIIDFASAALPQSSTGLSPFAVDCGYEPRTSFDWQMASSMQNLSLDREQAQQWMARLKEAWDQARQCLAAAQRQQEAQANKHRREPDFEVGDKVMVTTKHWNTGRPSRKLGEQAAGPYPIIEKVGHAYRVQLPDSIKVHPIFAPEKLRRAASTDPLPGQIEDQQPPIKIDGQEEWEVEDVLAVKLSRQKLYYRVRWVGHDDDPTWYPAQNFKNSPLRLRDFHRQYPDLPGPPKRLDDWLRAAENDDFLPDHDEDDRPQGWRRLPRRVRFADGS